MGSLFAFILGRDGKAIQHAHATRALQVTLDLSTAKSSILIDTTPIREILAVTVVSISGTAYLQMGGTMEGLLPLVAGQVRDGLDIRELYVSCPGTGGTAVIEIHGR